MVLGLLVGTLQRFSKTAVDGDEFVMSMRSASELGIPVIVGDAPQNDTIRSISQLFGGLGDVGVLADSTLGALSASLLARTTDSTTATAG